MPIPLFRLFLVFKGICNQLKNGYGFLGEMLCGMAADTGSGVRILVIGFLVSFTLLFCYGPPTLLPFLSEFVTAILPLQATLRGVLTSANDMNRSAGDAYTEGKSSVTANFTIAFHAADLPVH